MIESILLLGLASAAVSVLVGREQIAEPIRRRTVDWFGDHDKLYLIADLFLSVLPQLVDWRGVDVGVL